MTDETNKPEETSAEDLIKQGKDAARTAELKAQLEEANALENELKAKLRENAKVLGVKLAPNMSVENMVKTLSEARELLLQEDPEPELSVKASTSPEIEAQKARQALRQENLRLVRIRISNLNPAKANLPGEILCVHNDIVGTLKKFIPYNEAGEAYHVPMMLLKMLQRKKFLQIVQPPKGSRALPTQKLVKEYAIEVLEPLTEKELADLRKAQGAAESAED